MSHDAQRGLGCRKMRIHCAKEQRTTGGNDLAERKMQPI
jgi:hypothetical protein